MATDTFIASRAQHYMPNYFRIINSQCAARSSQRAVCSLSLLIYITPFIYKWDVNYTLGRVSCRKGLMASRHWAAIGRNSFTYKALPTERPKPQIIQRISTRASTCVIWRGEYQCGVWEGALGAVYLILCPFMKCTADSNLSIFFKDDVFGCLIVKFCWSFS